MQADTDTQPIVFVDFYNTLADDTFWNQLDDDIEAEIDTYLFSENRELADKWMRGEYTSEEIHKKVADELGYSYEKLWTGHKASCPVVEVVDGAEAALESVKDHAHLVLITDNMDCFDRFIVPHMPASGIFDEVYNSFNHGLLKTDKGGQLFERVANDHNTSLSDSFIIDDLQAVCETFENLGGTAFRIDSPDELVSALEGVKGRIKSR